MLLPLNSLEVTMNTFSVIVLGLAALFNFVMPFVMHTQNVISAILFKVIPFAIAVGLVAVILFEMGMVVMPAAGG